MIGSRSGGRASVLRLSRATIPGAALVMFVALMGIGGPILAQDASAPLGSMAPASSMAPGSTAPQVAAIPVTLADFTVTPNPMEASGLSVTFAVTNLGPTPHNLTIRDESGTILGATPDLSTGESAPLQVDFPTGGTFVTFCSLPGHESLGLVGELIVSEAPPMGSPAALPMASPTG